METTFKTPVFLLDIKKIFKDCPIYNLDNQNSLLRDWQHYIVQENKLAVFAEIWMGAVGIEGYIGLLIPPIDRDIDMLGYSHLGGEWDKWAFLTLITVPENNYKIGLWLSFTQGTYFDRNHDVICKIDSDSIKEEWQIETIYACGRDQGLSDAWQALFRIFQRELDAELAPMKLQSLL